MGDAADLGQALGVPTFAFSAGAEPEVLAAAGAEHIYQLPLPYDPEVHTATMAKLLQDFPQPARAILFPATGTGNELAPRLASCLQAVCQLDCALVRAVDGSLCTLRWAFDDRAQEKWEIPSGLTLVATVRSGSGNPWPRPKSLQVTHLEAATVPRNQRQELLAPDPASVRLSEAERIVAAGLGIGQRERLELVQELARLLGAALGASRPLADRGWVPIERQIGTTGQLVSPRLYVAIGISGATQHLSGVRDPETVIAINTDPSCPMMMRADLAVVGDASEVVAALCRQLQARQAEA